LSGLLPDLAGKCLEHLTQVVPRVSRVAVLWQPGAYPERTEKELLTAARGAGQALGVRLQFVEARSPADFDRAFSEMTKARVGALTVLPSALLIRERKRLVDLAAKHRLPAVCSVTEFVRDAGGLMVYGPNVPDLRRRAAAYVDKILKGAQPGDLHQELSASLVDKILKGARPATLPVAQPTKFDLLINLKTAKALGLTIPPSLLARADQIIE
jgi:putative ABC transport system substrate-binding protein